MGEAVQVLEYKFSHFPAKIKLAQSERNIVVDAVESCWTEMPYRRGHSKYHFRVRCGSEVYELSQDVASGIWSIQSEVKEQ